MAVTSVDNNYHRHLGEPRTGQRSPLPAVAGVVGIAALILAGGIKLDRDASAHQEKIGQDALEHVSHAANYTYVLKEGSHLRSAPMSTDGRPENGPDTIIDEVPEGKVLVVNKPAYSLDYGKWYVMQATNHTDGSQNEAGESKTYWVNFDDLGDVKVQGKDMIDGYAPVDAKPNLSTINVHLDSSNHLVDSTSQPVATAEFVDVDQLSTYMSDHHLQQTDK